MGTAPSAMRTLSFLLLDGIELLSILESIGPGVGLKAHLLSLDAGPLCNSNSD